VAKSKTRTQKRQCEEIARSVDGVARVLNDLKAIPQNLMAEVNFIDSPGKPLGKATVSEACGGGVRIHLNLKGRAHRWGNAATPIGAAPINRDPCPFNHLSFRR
jgi:hypothetical protein